MERMNPFSAIFARKTQSVDSTMATTGDSTTPSVSGSAAASIADQPATRKSRCLLIERQNLVHLTQLVIRDVIECTIAVERRAIDDDSESEPLRNLFAVLEHVVRHGLIARDLWSVFRLLDSACSDERDDLRETIGSVENLPSALGSAVGRLRAFLRMACMKKRLPDYFGALIQLRARLQSDGYYEPGALLLEEEAPVIQGMLVSLNFIDYNYFVKESRANAQAIDEALEAVNLVPYLKTRTNGEQGDGAEPTVSTTATERDELQVAEATIKDILDQKNYLEEHNEHLKAVLTNFQTKHDRLQARYDELAAAKNERETDVTLYRAETEQLREENERLKRLYERAVLQSGAVQPSKSESQDVEQASDAGVDNSALTAKARIRELEDSLAIDRNLRGEAETALRLLETEMHEKQDTLVMLRKQLDDLKQVNVEMFQKLQVAEAALRDKDSFSRRLQERTRDTSERLQRHGARIAVIESQRRAAEETARKLAQELAKRDFSKSLVETDLKLEQDERRVLEQLLGEHKERVDQLQGEMLSIRVVEDSYNDLQHEHDQLRSLLAEQEGALTEMGAHLSEEKLRVDEMREMAAVDSALSGGAQWQSDKAVNDCQLCDKPFTKLRRKHHCRSCGGIYCHACSDNTIQLPSARKPARCCDSCHVRMLARHSVAASASGGSARHSTSGSIG